MVSPALALVPKKGAISRFIETDKNNDNKLSLEEFLTQAATHFDNADADANGSITKDEVKGAIEARLEKRGFGKRAKRRNVPERLTGRLFEGFDLNEDGVISKQEQQSRLSKLFALADRNDDTFVDAREVEKAMRFFKRHRKGHHAKGYGRGHHGGRHHDEGRGE